jgi:hypothetical protein
MNLKTLHKTAAVCLALSLLLAACTNGASTPTGEAPPASSGGGTTPAAIPPGEITPQARPPTPTPAPSFSTPTGTQLSGPSQNTPLPESLPFEVIQAGAPIDGGPQALYLALRGDQAGLTSPAGLPGEAQRAVEAALAKGEARLILILYAGEMPSGGFSMQIESITNQQENGADILLVRYYIQPPDPQSGATTVITYPYLIASLPGDFAPEQVRFEKAR